MTDRDEFDSWASTHGCGRVYRSTDPHRKGEYEDSHTQLCWEAWQAARAKPVAPDGYVRELVEALQKIRDRADLFFSDESGMAVHSVEMILGIASAALAKLENR